MIPESVERIIENEAIRVELEMFRAHLSHELGTCTNDIISMEDSRKYGIKIEGLLSSVLSMYLKVKEL